MKVVWTARLDNMLMSLLAKRMTYRKAAELMTAELGMPFTKNSCIGRSKRLAMSRISPPKKGKPLTLYQLHQGLCKWPLGEPFDRPPFVYCGKPTGSTGCPWCPKHYEIAYSKSTYGSASLFRLPK